MNRDIHSLVRSLKRILICSITLLAVGSCGGGSSSPGTGSGLFLDAPVAGLRYVSGAIKGFTTANGRFNYTPGIAIQFYVGDILLGETVGDPLITPVDLRPGPVNFGPDVQKKLDAVTNIARFLQTVDNDGDPNNGQQISGNVNQAAAGKSINFDQTPLDFDADANVQIVVSELTAPTSAGARSLVAASDALNRMSQNIWSHYSGGYSGTYNGPDSGTFSVAFGANGSILGSGMSSQNGSFNIGGNVYIDGSFFMTAAQTGMTFNGVISPTKRIFGTWSFGNQGGDFTGQFR